MTRQDRRALTITVVASLVGCSLFALATRDGGSAVATNTTNTSAAPVASTDTTVAVVAAAPESTTPASVTASPDGLQDLDGEDLTVEDGCRIVERSIRVGATGDSVICLQNALIETGLYTGAVTGSFDAATESAVRRLQEERNLYVDGVVGRESAIELNIWPDEEAMVIRTPPPPAGAVDLMGYPMSTVSSAGPSAPPLPANSGSGRRLVYDRNGQRVWAVSADGDIIRSWLVSGSKYSNELAGTHEVYSRSDMSTAWNGKAYLPMMVRWLKTERGAIGFHSIPLDVKTGEVYQTEAELGQRLSGGCQRQAPADAKFLWDFAQVGTKVVVI